jgi:hypothetical protein
MGDRPQERAWRPLPRSYKGGFPFPVAVPSFVYPEMWSVNARRLGPFVDAIELLLFDGRPEHLPDAMEIQALQSSANDHRLTYNVHLPVDLALGADDRGRRRQGVERLAAVVTLVAPLHPPPHPAP